MSDFQNPGNKKGNNVYGLFIVLIVLIVVAVFIQGIYIQRLMKQVKYLSEKQAQVEFSENVKPAVIVKQKIETCASAKKDFTSNNN